MGFEYAHWHIGVETGDHEVLERAAFLRLHLQFFQVGDEILMRQVKRRESDSVGQQQLLLSAVADGVEWHAKLSSARIWRVHICKQLR